MDAQEAEEEAGGPGRLVKGTVQEAFNNYQVDCVNFSVLSSDEISRYSEVEVLNYAQYDLANERPFVYGPLDGRMGSSSKSVLCSTCNKRLNECVGHFGHVSLALPVFHAGYLRHTHQVLASVCKACARLLLPVEALDKYKKRLRRPQTDDLQRQMLQKRILQTCKSTRLCPHCGHHNTSFRKGTGVPLILRHAVGPTNKQAPEEISLPFLDSFNEAKSFNKDLESYTDKASEDFNPLVARLGRIK